MSVIAGALILAQSTDLLSQVSTEIRRHISRGPDAITEFTGPDTARGVCRFAVHTGRSPNIQGAGTYRDEYRRTPDGWRFVSRLISFFYMGERATEWPSTPPSITPPTVDAAEGI